ncbi:MAG: hypothetical protein NVSMB32_09200 [Actinomycetota bacterium]
MGELFIVEEDGRRIDLIDPAGELIPPFEDVPDDSGPTQRPGIMRSPLARLQPRHDPGWCVCSPDCRCVAGCCDCYGGVV